MAKRPRFPLDLETGRLVFTLVLRSTGERLDPFGKFICTGAAPPKCSTCLLLSMCRQLGVDKHR